MCDFFFYINITMPFFFAPTIESDNTATLPVYSRTRTRTALRGQGVRRAWKRFYEK